MSEIKVSVNVAVYNTSKYLRQCLDSLVNQTLRDIEIILVNDGSTDDSGAICDEYAAKDARIKVIHKSNGGLASARQVGLAYCRGEYMICCDSDDWVEHDMYEQMYNQARREGCDVVMCPYYCHYSNGEQTRVDCKPVSYNPVDLIKQVLSYRIPPSCWNKLWRRDFFDRHDLSWEIGINQGEDALMLLKQLQYPLTLSYLPVSLYHYRRDLTGTSYTNNLTFSTFQQIERIDRWKSEHLPSELYGKELFIGQISFLCSGFRVKDMPQGYHRELINRLFSVLKLWRYNYWTAKSMLLLLSKLSYPLSRFVFVKLYPIVYR